MITEEVFRWRIGGPLPRTAPFLLFMAFIAVSEGVELLASYGLFALSETSLYYLYPVKTLAVAALLLLYWSEYDEVRWTDLQKWKVSLPVLLAAVATCAIWVSLDISLAPTGAPKGFNPTLLPSGSVRVVMTLFRLAGAVLIVPVTEELFWRSFLIRYLIDPDFESVEIGRFTWSSFIVTTLLFGLEHHFILASIAAGVVFNLVLYKTRSLAQCILAHAITNLALGCYVLYTGQWYFW